MLAPFDYTPFDRLRVNSHRMSNYEVKYRVIRAKGGKKGDFVIKRGRGIFCLHKAGQL